MILVDTAIWVDHLNKGDQHLTRLLNEAQVLIHPFVLGEIALGSLRERGQRLGALARIPTLLPVRHSEVMTLIESQGLAATGLGYVDAHVVASALARPGTTVWTRDRRLEKVARRLGLAYEPRVH